MSRLVLSAIVPDLRIVIRHRASRNNIGVCKVVVKETLVPLSLIKF